MPIVKPSHNPIGVYARKKFGKGRSYGTKMYGYPRYGTSEPVYGKGVYGQKSYGETKYGQAVAPFGIYQVRKGEKKKKTVKMKYYVPYNPRTATQQAWRSNFADAVSSWQSLTDTEKEKYNEKAKGNSLSGFNLYISEYLRS